MLNLLFRAHNEQFTGVLEDTDYVKDVFCLFLVFGLLVDTIANLQELISCIEIHWQYFA